MAAVASHAGTLPQRRLLLTVCMLLCFAGCAAGQGTGGTVVVSGSQGSCQCNATSVELLCSGLMIAHVPPLGACANLVYM